MLLESASKSTSDSASTASHKTESDSASTASHDTEPEQTKLNNPYNYSYSEVDKKNTVLSGNLLPHISYVAT